MSFVVVANDAKTCVANNTLVLTPEVCKEKLSELCKHYNTAEFCEEEIHELQKQYDIVNAGVSGKELQELFNRYFINADHKEQLLSTISDQITFYNNQLEQQQELCKQYNIDANDTNNKEKLLNEISNQITFYNHQLEERIEKETPTEYTPNWECVEINSFNKIVKADTFKHLNIRLYNSIMQNIANIEKLIEELEKKKAENDQYEAEVKKYVKDNHYEYFNMFITKYEDNKRALEKCEQTEEIKLAIMEAEKEFKSFENNYDEYVDNYLEQKYKREHPNDYCYNDDMYKIKLAELEAIKREHEYSAETYIAECNTVMKESEREELKRKLKMPHSKEDILRHMKEFNHDCISSEFAELYDYYGILIVEALGNKYEKTINSVISERGNDNFRKVFAPHNDNMNKHCMIISEAFVNELDNNDTNEEYYNEAEKLLKKKLEQEINKHFSRIADWLKNTIDNISKPYIVKDTDSSTIVKSYARDIVSGVIKYLKNKVAHIKPGENVWYCNQDGQLCLTQTITKKPTVEEVPEEVSEEAPVRVPIVEESHSGYELREVVEEAPVSFSDFSDLIEPGKEYDIQEITGLWNDSHNTELSTISVSKLTEIKNAFNKKRKSFRGKQQQVYVLKA